MSTQKEKSIPDYLWKKSYQIWNNDDDGNASVSNDNKENFSYQFSSLNPNLKNMEHDYLYHLDIEKNGNNLVQKYGDIKFVITGGSAARMKSYICYLKQHLNLNSDIQDLTSPNSRFSLFKLGPIICVNHGMGIPSLIILLNEIFKLLYYAKCKDVSVLRLGTCGGIGVEPGTVVLTDKAINEQCRPVYEMVHFGKTKYFNASVDKKLVEYIKSVSTNESNGYQIKTGTTMATSDFYEGQARCDGAFCEYSKEDSLDYLNHLKNLGVINIEMEATAFSALCSRANVRFAIINVVLVNRIENDQIDSSNYGTFQLRPISVAAKYILSKLN